MFVNATQEATFDDVIELSDNGSRKGSAMDEEIGSQSSGNFSSSQGTTYFRKKIEHVKMEDGICRSTLFSYLIILIGSIACTSFLYLGVAWAKYEQKDIFDRMANELAHGIHGTWNDYQVAGLWIHQACRSRNISRAEFRALYEHLRWDGLDFQAAEFIPKIHHSERAKYETDSRAFYAEQYPELDEYRGFVGLEEDPDGSGNLSLQLRSNQSFYYPVHYVEPVLANSAAIDFDLYSSESRRRTIDAALETWEPTLTSRLRLVQETDESAYSVLLMHPGIPIDAEPEASPSDLSLIVIRIPSLLERAMRIDDQILQVYVYDRTLSNEEQPPEFLGASEVQADHGLNFLPEIDYLTIQENAHSKQNSLFFEKHVSIASSSWSIIVLPVEGSFKLDITFVILGGAIIFIASACLALWMYRHSSRRASRMARIIEKAEAESYIVSSMFPSKVRARLLKNVVDKEHKNSNETAKVSSAKPGPTSESVFGSQPIADLFPNTTIMFADLVGFTAWSSAREPAHVFTLLETVYHSFDTISTRLKVFKVETVGDCYVAVAGLPHPRKDHAVVMARFAMECITTQRFVARELESSLGPDTGNIQIRIGLHSGPVTAGVLRGLKGRFQLFGDTMNTASRMESTSKAGMVQVSNETAEILIRHGKASWLTPREDVVNAKGKGELLTYWLSLAEEYDDTYDLVCDSAVKQGKPGTIDFFRSNSIEDTDNQKARRLIDWHVQVLSTLIKKVVASRIANSKITSKIKNFADTQKPSNSDMIPFQEVKDIITLPTCHSCKMKTAQPNSIELDARVMDELTSFVSTIASLYRVHHFHNFEHASHVTMSVTKLLFRIISPKYMVVDQKETRCPCTGKKKAYGCDLHTCTYGIASDPLTQFACAFSALIHDVGHAGVPNSTLVKEGGEIALYYKNKSVAEQNSVDITWKILMGEKFTNLRNCIFQTQEDIYRFRQLIVNLVLATDVIDQDVAALRQVRWENAFPTTADDVQARHRDIEDSTISSMEQECMNRKATQVLEHLMQASAVSHTMQHWHVYIKWNQCLFHEMYHAYRGGRIEKDPSVDWYEDEKHFFDEFVIPVAKKLEKCGVFRESSHEYLDYAIKNRHEWDSKGKEIVEELLKSYEPALFDELKTESEHNHDV